MRCFPCAVAAVVCSLGFLGAGAGAASAEPARGRGSTYAELVAGLAAPVGDDDYEAVVDPSFLLGARVGGVVVGGRRGGLALEGSLVGQFLSIDDPPAIDVGFSYRLRLAAGARLFYDIKRVRLFGRFGIGLDYANVSAEDAFLGIDLGGDDLGLLLEPGGGVLFDLGGTAVGLQLALPVAIHDDDDDDVDLDPDYTSTDLDVLLTVGTRF